MRCFMVCSTLKAVDAAAYFHANREDAVTVKLNYGCAAVKWTHEPAHTIFIEMNNLS